MLAIDLRSDTVTLPTSAMRTAMGKAEVGDDGYGEDLTVNRLEAIAAARLGKEAAAFVPSGRMGNLVSALSFCERGDQMVVGDLSHIFQNEVSAATLMGIGVHTVPNDTGGTLDLEALEAALSSPRTTLVCLENTHGLCGGSALGLDHTYAVAEVARRHGAALHLDGARLFNASVALNVDVAELTRAADTVSFCLSKGLGCPMGSVVCGTRDVIERVRKFRKIIGGGMRQAGIVAAAGLVALDTMVDRLAEDHALAHRLAVGLAQQPGLVLRRGAHPTNIVILDMPVGGADDLAAQLGLRGVLVSSLFGGRMLRMVTHLGITSEEIDRAIAIFESLVHKRSTASDDSLG